MSTPNEWGMPPKFQVGEFVKVTDASDHFEHWAGKTAQVVSVYIPINDEPHVLYELYQRDMGRVTGWTHYELEREPAISKSAAPPMAVTEDMIGKGAHVLSEHLCDEAPLRESRYRDPAKDCFVAMFAAMKVQA